MKHVLLCNNCYEIVHLPVFTVISLFTCNKFVKSSVYLIKHVLLYFTVV